MHNTTVRGYRMSIHLLSLTLLCVGCAHKAQNQAISFEPVPAVILEGSPASLSLVERMDYYGVTAVSLAVIDSGEIAFVEAIGTISERDPTPINEDTLFQAASISKAVTALAVVTWADQRAIELHAPAHQYLKSWSLPSSQFMLDDPITIADLLSHTAGVSVASYSGYRENEALPGIDDILEGRPPANEPPVRSIAPQGVYAYSGGGYMMLQKLIEDQTGRSFAAHVRETLLEPLGAHRTSFDPHFPNEASPNVAFGHDFAGKPHEAGWLVYPQAAPAGLWSTPRELALIMRSYLHAYSGRDERRLSASAARRMADPIVEGMGLGFGAHRRGHVRLIDHAGWTRGYRAYVVAFPDLQEGAVVMTNGDGGNRLIEEIVRGLARARGWPGYEPRRVQRAVWSAERFQRLAGSYRMMPANFKIEIEALADALRIRTPRGSRLAYPIAEQELIIVEDGSTMSVDLANDSLSFLGMTAIRSPDQ